MYDLLVILFGLGISAFILYIYHRSKEQGNKNDEKEEGDKTTSSRKDFLKKLGNHLYWFPSLCWIIFLLTWWLTRPILFKHYIATLPSLGFHLLFLVALPILIGVESRRYGKIILSFITVALFLFIGITVLSIFTPDGQSVCDELEARITTVENEKKAEKAEETIRNSQREKLFAELEKLEDGKDSKSLPRIKEIRTELANLNPQPEQPEKRERIVKEFDIPAGNGRNEDSNIYTTGILPEGNNVRITVLKGGPAHCRRGFTDNDRYRISDSLTITNTVKGGEVQFIKHKPVKVRVEIIPRT